MIAKIEHAVVEPIAVVSHDVHWSAAAATKLTKDKHDSRKL
jgi:hypothetical protein